MIRNDNKGKKSKKKKAQKNDVHTKSKKKKKTIYEHALSLFHTTFILVTDSLEEFVRKRKLPTQGNRASTSLQAVIIPQQFRCAQNVDRGIFL